MNLNCGCLKIVDDDAVDDVVAGAMAVRDDDVELNKEFYVLFVDICCSNGVLICVVAFVVRGEVCCWTEDVVSFCS